MCKNSVVELVISITQCYHSACCSHSSNRLWARSARLSDLFHQIPTPETIPMESTPESTTGGREGRATESPFTTIEREGGRSMSPGGVRNRQPPQVLDNTYLKGLLKGDIKVTKLNRDNYQSWARNMRISLDAKLLWDLVKGTIPEPDVRIRPNDHRAWWIDNNHAKMWINNNLEEDQQTHCSEEERYAHNIWMTLYKVHGVDSQGRMMMLKRKIYTYKARTDETIDEIAS